MPRAVLDANVLASALIRPAGPPGQILVELLERRAFDLVASLAILSELRRCLDYPRVRERLAATDEDLDLWGRDARRDRRPRRRHSARQRRQGRS